MSAADGKLRDGMLIVASIRARLFGLQLLQLNADVTVTPASERRRARAVEARRRPSSLPSSNGTVGGGLAEAAKALEATSGELVTARRRMP